jgi:hypothetical protein
MNNTQLEDIAGRALAAVIIFCFFLLLYTKLMDRTLGEAWDDIKHVFSGGKK